MNDLGVTKTHSRPHALNDNPYSAPQFKTLKCDPDFSDRAGALCIACEGANAWVGSFFDGYNQGQYHCSLGLLTRASVDYGLATEQLELCQRILDDAFSAHPERIVRKAPSVQPLPKSVWINCPQSMLGVGEEPPVGV